MTEMYHPPTRKTKLASTFQGPAAPMPGNGLCLSNRPNVGTVDDSIPLHLHPMATTTMTKAQKKETHARPMIISHVSFESVYSASQTSHSLCLALIEPYVVDWAQSTRQLTNLTHSLFEVFHTDFQFHGYGMNYKSLNCFILTFTGRPICHICCHSIIQLNLAG